MVMKGDERVASSGWLEQKSEAELIDIYNSTMPKTKVKSFRSIAEAVRMILERLVEVERRKPSRKPKPRRGRPLELLDLPPRLPRKRLSSRKPRRSTQREILFRLLSRPKGTTMAQIESALEVSRKLARENLRQINLDFGYGIKENEDGKVYIHDKGASR